MDSNELLRRFKTAGWGGAPEIQAFVTEAGVLPRDDNPLKHAPHTMGAVVSDAWAHAYSREKAAFPLPWVRDRKFWPAVGRVDNAYGDRNLICSCPPIEEYNSELTVDG